MQDLEDKPWRNEGLKSLEEGMTSLKEGDSEKAARNYKALTGVGCNGFRTEVPLDLSKRTRGDVVEFLEKEAQCGRCPQQACTTMFFLIPHLDSLEWMRALEVSRWQQRHRASWDVPDVRNGGAERIMLEPLVEWKDSTAEQAHKNQERSRWSLTWLKPSSTRAFQLCGLGQRISNFL